MKITNKYVFFWSGIYSQWHKANMTIDGVKYNSCEQYMMHQKALTFGDKEIAKLIMEETNPKEQKKYGRMIKNFDKSVWDKVCLGIVIKGNYFKFKQNENLRTQLLSMKDRVFVEASPVDHIWGIGMSEDDPNVEYPMCWKGLNLLGQAITIVRNELVNC